MAISNIAMLVYRRVSVQVGESHPSQKNVDLHVSMVVLAIQR